jgi:copper(I)-binding protein
MHHEHRFLLKVSLLGMGFYLGMLALLPHAFGQGRPHRTLEAREAQIIRVDKVWAREATEKDRSTAVFMLLENPTDRDDALVGASSPRAGRVQLHRTFRNDLGVVLMEPVEQIPLPAGQAVELKPGGWHLFMAGVREPLRMGMEFPLTLEFANSRRQNVRVKILSKRDEDIYPAHSLR